MPTRFIDGPANGVSLSIRRAPMFLRVVHDTEYAKAICKKGRQEWDCLDQTEDTPRQGETISVYRLIENRGTVHINRGRHGSGFFKMATYRFHEPQPDDATLRSKASWQEWCQAEFDRLKDDDERGPQ